MGRRPTTLQALALAVLMVLPAASAGTFEDPEIDDTTQDATISESLAGDVDAMIDINRTWITRDGSDLAFHIYIVGSDFGYDNAATTVNATWHVAFTANGSDWRIRLDWTGAPPAPGAALYRNGSRVNASVSESHDGKNITLTWTDAVPMLGSDAVLTDLFAFTQADGNNDVDCNGFSVVDCAPNPAEGFGRDYSVAGPASKLSISASPTDQTLEKGEIGVFDVTVANQGADPFNVTLSSDAPSAWETSFVPGTLNVSAGSSASAAFNVKVPSDAEAGPTNVSISAGVDGSSVSTTISVNVTNATGGNAIPYSFTAATTSKTTTAGEPVGYDVVITNDGSESDKYSIHVDQGQKSWVSFSSKQVEIPGGESKTISVQVEPPAATGVGTYDHLIGVHPLSNPPNTKTVTLTTTVEEGGTDDEGGDGGFSLEDLLGSGQRRTITLAALGAVALLIVIIGVVALKRRRDRGFYGEPEDDDDHIYRP